MGAKKSTKVIQPTEKVPTFAPDFRKTDCFIIKKGKRKMKNLVLAFAAFAAISFASCGNGNKTANNETCDSTATHCDSMKCQKATACCDSMACDSLKKCAHAACDSMKCAAVACDSVKCDSACVK